MRKNEKGLPELPVPAVLHRLIGRSRVIFAVGRLIAWGMAAEAEIFRAWIADRPFAGLVGEVEDGHPPVLGQIHQAQGLGLGNGQLPGHRLRPHHRLFAG